MGVLIAQGADQYEVLLSSRRNDFSNNIKDWTTVGHLKVDNGIKYDNSVASWLNTELLLPIGSQIVGISHKKLIIQGMIISRYTCLDDLEMSGYYLEQIAKLANEPLPAFFPLALELYLLFGTPFHYNLKT